MMIIHSCQLRMLGQMTMLLGQQVLNNVRFQLKLGVGTDGPSHYWSWPMTMVTSLQCCVRCQPHVLTYTEICCGVKNLLLTPVKTSRKDGLYPRIFKFFTSCHFSPHLYLRKLKVKLCRHSFYFVRSWQSDVHHGGEECPAHAYGPFVVKDKVLLKVPKKGLR